MKSLMTMILFCAITTGVMAQNNVETQSLSKQEEKSIRKAQQKTADSLLYVQAVQALNDREFVLEADKLISRQGRIAFVSSNTNFVRVNGEEATVQIALNTSFSGPNGIGGITVDGLISEVKNKTDKKGNMTYTFSVQGVGISAQVEISLPYGTNNAQVRVNPNFNSNRTTLSGVILPLEMSNIFKGRSL